MLTIIYAILQNTECDSGCPTALTTSAICTAPTKYWERSSQSCVSSCTYVNNTKYNNSIQCEDEESGFPIDATCPFYHTLNITAGDFLCISSCSTGVLDGRLCVLSTDLILNVQVHFFNGSLWTLGGKVQMYDLVTLKLVVTDQLNSSGGLWYVDDMDKLLENHDYVVKIRSPNGYVIGETTFTFFDHDKILVNESYDSSVTFTLMDYTGGNPVVGEQVNVQMIWEEQVFNYQTVSDTNGIAYFYFSDKVAPYTDVTFTFIDPNNSIPMVIKTIPSDIVDQFVTLQLNETYYIMVTVLDIYGKPIRGASIFVDNVKHTLDNEITGDAGQVSLMWADAKYS